MPDAIAAGRMPWAKDSPGAAPRLVEREWLVGNGLGGYAAGTLGGVCTRRFHGLLTAALPAPLGRMLVLNHVAEEVVLPDGRKASLGGDEVAQDDLRLEPAALAGFRLESGLPVWRYEVLGLTLEKSLVLPHGQNTVFLRYRLLEGGPARLHARPSFHFRGHGGRVDERLERPYRVSVFGERWEVRGEPDAPPLRLLARGEGAALVLDGGRFRTIYYRMERSRGYDAVGTLWSPGYLRADLPAGGEATLGASTEPWETFAALEPADAFAIEHARRERLLALASEGGASPELALAADLFVITPNVRVADAARARALGDDVRSIVAGYHWFTDWGRDTMISLEGLTLATGRHREAGCVLRTFGRHFRDGLIPNLFPEGRQEGLYHSADATLWFFHALGRYVAASGDRETLRGLLPALEDSVARHLAGTRFGIGVDPLDGLLRQGQEGYQLTWMDAKMGDWVVTPRRGKAVEVNALWYNALRLMEEWTREERGEGDSRRYAALAERAADSFNKRFWNEERGCLYDVLDGDPAAAALLRPNQVFAVSLPHAVLEPARRPRVLETLRERLLTPVGLRSLAPGEPGYKPRYDGDLRARDGAYHQGTVWAWLIGPYVDAHLKVNPGDKAGARRLLAGLEAHLQDACVGSISEIFDAEEPYTPRGCVAQAWSVAEVLRAHVATAA